MKKLSFSLLGIGLDRVIKRVANALLGRVDRKEKLFLSN